MQSAECILQPVWFKVKVTVRVQSSNNLIVCLFFCISMSHFKSNLSIFHVHHIVLQRKTFAFELFFCNSFRQRALVIWKEQTKIHQHAQQIEVDIL